MKMLINIVIGSVLFCSNAVAAEFITADHIRQVIKETDAAAKKRDAQGIGVYLAEDFYKYVDVASADLPAAVQIDKYDYLELIEEGWERTTDYTYERIDLVIQVAPDGSSGESRSTIVETLSIDGTEMVSKVREYAGYKLEDGRAVIFNIESHTLVGDTTPE